MEGRRKKEGGVEVGREEKGVVEKEWGITMFVLNTRLNLLF